MLACCLQIKPVTRSWVFSLQSRWIHEDYPPVAINLDVKETMFMLIWKSLSLLNWAFSLLQKRLKMPLRPFRPTGCSEPSGFSFRYCWLGCSNAWPATILINYTQVWRCHLFPNQRFNLIFTFEVTFWFSFQSYISTDGNQHTFHLLLHFFLQCEIICPTKNSSIFQPKSYVPTKKHKTQLFQKVTLVWSVARSNWVNNAMPCNEMGQSEIICYQLCFKS